MSDDELDALFKRANEAMLAHLDATVDVEARLAEVLRKAGVRSDLYAGDSSPAGEVSEREEPA
jgi:hypothetical protein